ncbi:MAG: hypothetical protein ACI93R_002576 [Flavobacteriales bacterium]|jgi:hypothetical protein
MNSRKKDDKPACDLKILHEVLKSELSKEQIKRLLLATKNLDKYPETYANSES